MKNIIEKLNKIMGLVENHNLSEARISLERIESNIPDDGPMQKIMGQLFQCIGADAKSLYYISRARELLPNDKSLLLNLAYHYLDNGEPKLAINYFKEYLLTEAPTSRVLCFLGRAYDYDGYKDKAERVLYQAIELMPSDLESHLHLGRILIAKKKYEEALDCFKKINFFHPDDLMVDLSIKRVNALLRSPSESSGHIKSLVPATVVCVKHGKKYEELYVNRLASMVKRWSSVDVDFFCLTDDPSGLVDGIRTLPLPDKNAQGQNIEGWWHKLAMFRKEVKEFGSHILYFDVDVVITGSIDPLLYYDSDFVLAQNCYVPTFSSSVMRFKNGIKPDIWSDFSEINAQKYGGDEIWIASKVPGADVFPEEWCKIYRLHGVNEIPKGAIVVSFGGEPNPGDYPSPWIKDYWI